MVRLSAGWRHTIRQFRGLLLTGVALALGTTLGTEEADAQFLGQNVTTGNASGASATGTNSTAVGTNSAANGNRSTALGETAVADANETIAIGKDAYVGGFDSIGIGFAASAAGTQSVALGHSAGAGNDSTALGHFANANAIKSTAIGSSAFAFTESIAIGYQASATGIQANAIGRFTSAAHNGSMAIGDNAVTNRGLQMKFGTSVHTYTMPGITSSLSAFAGASGQFVVSDVNGNLAVSDVNTNRVGFGTFTPDANSRMDIRSSTLSNGILMKRTDAGAHYLRIEDSSGSAFRCGVQGNGDTQFGALGATKGLALVAGGTGKLAINSSGKISFGSSIPANPLNHAVIHSSGAHLTTGGVWTSVSSRAAKQDIEPITSEEARETVRALQPVGYRYKTELDERYVGFIAEDVPELVATRDRKGLAPMDITAVLTKVVQDQDRLLVDQGQQLAEERQRNEKERQRNDKQERLIESLMQRLADLELRSDGTAPTK